MGARLVRAALCVMPEKLPNGPRLVLVAMALRAMDSKRGNQPAATYFGGRYRLLGDLGTIPTTTSLRHLRADLRTLRDAGLLSVSERPGPGRQTVYELHLPVDNLPP